jgi:hypothetical protein
VGFGAPLLADPNFALAYPPTWLNLVLAPATYYKLLVVSHCIWGGLGVLLLAHHRGLAADASLVAASAYCLSEVDATNVLIGTDFDPNREVPLAGNHQASPAHADFRASSRILSRRADSLSLEGDLESAAVLVVLEAHQPVGQAAVDGYPAPILQANGLFRGVPLAAGRHRMEMVLRPCSAAWGALLSPAQPPGGVGAPGPGKFWSR